MEYSIQELSRLSGVTTRALRWYCLLYTSRVQQTFRLLFASIAGPPYTRIRPSSMRTTRSAICASSRLWVIITSVCR